MRDLKERPPLGPTPKTKIIKVITYFFAQIFAGSYKQKFEHQNEKQGMQRSLNPTMIMLEPKLSRMYQAASEEG